jgi:tetratricopeptide (TPR) repeat protein
MSGASVGEHSESETASGRTVDVRGATGVQIGASPQMHLHLRSTRPPWWTRSGYIEQVRDIAPGGGLPGMLRVRDLELAELAGFCTGDEDYLWWKAGPWAGKSALLSTFVLNPPPQVEVVSFFITARLAAQSDSAAFTDALIDQLSAIVGESMPGSLTPIQRDAHRRALLRAVVDKVRGEGRRLLLVVDGLDEDRGVRLGSGLASVASLLPKVCGEGLRVVVSSRPNPQLPGDVPADHPLRRRCRIRELTASEHAIEIAERAGRELQELLHGDRLHLDVLGLITACGGGLRPAELEELTGLPPYQLEGLLGGVFGRTVADRVDHTGTGSPRLYLFAHETLRETATRSLGTALGPYQDRLHTWAERYRKERWPVSTPQYLLRGYARMLADLGDTDRLVALALDPVRHDRMLNVSGGDTAALIEVTTAQDLVMTQPEPDLLTMTRLSIQRHDLQTRNANIPINLPAVWATLGQAARAESLANGISDLYQRARSLAGIARSVANLGDPDRSRRLTVDAEAMVRTIGYPLLQVWALTDIAQAVAEIGDLDRAWQLAADAEAIIRTIGPPSQQAVSLARLARAAVGIGDLERAQQLAADAEAIVCTITDPYWHGQALADIAKAVAGIGDLERARQLAADAEAIAHTITDPYLQGHALADIALAVADAGEPGRAEEIAHTITDPYGRGEALAGITRAVADAGDPDRAEAIARTITDPDQQVRALVDVAQAVADAGDPNRARQLVADAEAIARTITHRYRHDCALTVIVQAVAAAGDFDRAEAIARTITDPEQQAWAFVGVADAVAGIGNPDHARQLVADAEAIACTITDPDRQAQMLPAIAHIVATTGDPDRAEAIARTITDPSRQAQALACVAQAVAAADLDRAQQLVTDAEAIARTITDFYRQAWPLVDIAHAVAAVGDPDRAEAIARTITDPDEQAEALVRIAEIVGFPGASRLLGGTLAIGSWWLPLPVLATLRPQLVLDIAARMTTRSLAFRDDQH